MPLDGITAKFLAEELNRTLADARLDRIFQPDRYDIVLQFRQGSQNYRLLLSANPAAPRLHLTDESRENPSEPPMFCMLLRKHLAGARLIDVSTPGYERIFQFRFQTVNELGDRLEKRLLIEIMGRYSNIILLNQENRIHDAILHVDQSISRVREIMPARVYVAPPAQTKRSPADVVALLSQGQAWLDPASAHKPLDKALLDSLQGFSPQLCQDIVERSGLDRRFKAEQLNNEQHEQLNRALGQVLTAILAGRYRPTAFYEDEHASVPIDFHALPLLIYAYAKPTDGISQAMDLFYLERSRQNILHQKKQSLEKRIANQLDHVRRKWEIHDTDRREGAKQDDYRRFGELILANLAHWSEGQDHLSAVDYYQPDQPIVDIPLESNRNATQNAQRYFRLYAKARNRYETGSRLAENDRQEIIWLESIRNNLAAAGDNTDIQAIRQEMDAAGLLSEGQEHGRKQDHPRLPAAEQPGKPGSRSKRKQNSSLNSRNKAAQKAKSGPAPLPPRQFISSDGLVILVGRNNLQNDQLTLKTAQKDDLWLHVQKIPGTHVIIRANRRPVPERSLLEAAEIAAWFSRAAAALPEYGGDSSHKVAVDYCPAGHVRKPAGARPGMVIYEHYQTILVTPRDPQDRVGSSL